MNELQVNNKFMKANLGKVIIQARFEPHNNPKEATMPYFNTDSLDFKLYIKKQDQINNLLKVFLERELKKEPQQKQAPQQKKVYNLEPRDNHVFIPLPNIDPGSALTKTLLESWIYKVMKTVCSTGFNMFLKGEIDQKQTKIYCSLNIMQNIAALNIQHKLTKEHFRIITEYTKNNVLPYLLAKYPMTNQFQINRKLEAVVNQIDNISAVQNSFFAFQNIIFEYRSSGNYNDLIMKMLNSIKNKTNSTNGNNTTFYQQFQSLMSRLFQKVEDMDWMDQKQRQITKNNQENYSLRLVHAQSKKSNSSGSENKKVQKQKYKNRVKEYSSYQIGRKIPQSTTLYSQNQISNTRISIKHVSQLRILVKWCKQLFQKYEKNFFSCSSDAVKVQRGDFVHHLLIKEKEQLDQLLSKQLPQIKKFLDDLSQFNYQIQPQLLDQKMENQINDYQKICGKYSYRMFYVIKTQIILYLNKLIHGLLKAAYVFYWNQAKFAQIRWNSPPNLLTFKIGDLIRCKFSSKQREILAIYNEIYKIHENNPEILKIIKIKNRLKTHTNDILIIVQFKNCFNCEIQLAIKSEVSNFIKCSNHFNHYLYELDRSPLGPLAQICNVWMSQDERYLRTFKKLIKKQKDQKDQKNRQCFHLLEQSSTLKKSFICSHCSKIYLHNNYVLQHKKCKICKYKRCAECLLQQYDFQRLKKLLFKRQNIEDKCLRLVRKKQPNFEGFQYGVSVFLESKIPIVKYFKVVKYKETTYLINKNNGSYKKIADVSSTQLLQQFLSKNIVIGLKGNCKMTPFESEDAIKSFILPNLILKETYEKEKDIINLSLKLDGKYVTLDTKTCRDILMKGNEQHRKKIKVIAAQESKLERIPISGEQFPNLKTLIIKNEKINPLHVYQRIQTFAQLRQFTIKGNQLEDIPVELLKLYKLQTIKIQDGLCRIPKQFDVFQNLKILDISRCWLENSSFKIICRCLKLEWIELYDNNLTKIAKQIVNLKQLQYFSVNFNQIDSLPIELFQLQKLKQLNVRANLQLKVIPQEINDSQIEFLIINRTKIHPQYAFHAKNLRQIRAQKLSCQNAEIPDNISNCAQLTAIYLNDFKFQKISPKIIECQKLKILYLQNNGLVEIPLFFQQLVNLEILSLAKNKIDGLNQKLFLKMHKLKRLYLNQNYLQLLPDISNSIEMKALYVSFNKLKEIPEFISQLPYLNYISFQNNPISVLPQFLQTLQNISIYDFNSCPITQIKCMSWLNNIHQKYNKFTKLYTFAKRDIEDQMSFKESFTIETFQKWQIKGTKIPSKDVQQCLNKIYKTFGNVKARIQQMNIIEFCKITYRSTITLSHTEASVFQQFQVYLLENQDKTLAQLKQMINTENKEAQITVNIIEIEQMSNTEDSNPVSCCKCNKNLSYPFYWLKWQPGIAFGCRSCVEQKAISQEQNYHFDDKNNSVLIPKPITTKIISPVNLGNKIQQQQKSTQWGNKHSFQRSKVSKKKFEY